MRRIPNKRLLIPFLLLIDCHRINDTLYDSAPVGTEFPLDVDLIDRIEVVRGPAAAAPSLPLSTSSPERGAI